MPTPEVASLCTRIVREVAEKKGVDAMDLQPPLYDAINPDAMDALFGGSDGELTFEYCGYSVSIDSDREVSVDPIDTPSLHDAIPEE